MIISDNETQKYKNEIYKDMKGHENNEQVNVHKS